MPDEKHEPNRNGHFRQKLLSAAAILLLVLLAVRFGLQYLSFVSQTIYQESTSHLEEVLHKSNNMLSMIVKKNISYLHLWNGFLSSDPDDASTQAYLESAQQQLGFAEFYFLSYDGNYMTPGGETGYLGLQTNLDELLSDQKDVVLNTALPGQDPMLVFICPETKGIYRGFAYDAVAISYYNDAVLKLLDNSAFQGNASNYVIYSDGRVVIDNSVNREKTIYNFIAMLRDYSDLSEEEILTLSDDFAQGRSGNRKVTLGDTRYYLVYEGTAVQSWTMLGLVPVNIVNANLDKLWFRTAQIVTGIAVGLAAAIILLILHRNRTTLRRKDTEISYRDELFQKLSLNVDDVFLMLDAETSKVDYVSPNIERLLGMIFNYWPMLGAQIAFRDYQPRAGIWNSPWVGFKHFIKFFHSYQFERVLGNTLILSFYSLAASFPLSILMALAINLVRRTGFKKFVQTVSYMPYFISVVVLVGILNQVLSPVVGIYGGVYRLFCGSGYPPDILANAGTFRHLYVWSGIWQSLGWNTIIYLAALSSVDLELHEAAQLDGANRLKRVVYIDLPILLPTAAIMLILSVGSLMSVGFDKAYLMQNNANLSASEIISTYIYKTGMNNGTAQFSYATAIGLFNSAVNCCMLLVVNKLADKVVLLTPQGTRMYPGNYDSYLEAREKEQAADVRLPLDQARRKPPLQGANRPVRSRTADVR